MHGLTLGFGVTLIGEAVDYSIYLFVQRTSHAGGDWRHSVWPTIRLGALTSIAGFAALLPSDFQGLAQLGLYSDRRSHRRRPHHPLRAARVAAARVCDPRPGAARAPGCCGFCGNCGVCVRRCVLVALLAGRILVLHRGALLSHDLAALSPFPLAEQDLDERLRAELGAPDVRYMVVTAHRSPRPRWRPRTSRRATPSPLVDAGVIAGFESPAATCRAGLQRARQQSLPPAPQLRDAPERGAGGPAGQRGGAATFPR